MKSRSRRASRPSLSRASGCIRNSSTSSRRRCPSRRAIFYTLRDLQQEGYQPDVVRYLLASVPYRKKLNFSADGLKAAATAIDRLRNFKRRLETDKYPEGTSEKLLERTRAALRQ